MVVRNSAECAHCGEVVSCTHKSPLEWVQHDCEEGTFKIRGGGEYIERLGVAANYQDTSVVQLTAALDRKYNPTGQSYFDPRKVG